MIFKIVELKESDLKAAAAMYTDDYEDAVQMCQAKRIGADHIVTRNVRDYKNSPVPALTPTEYLNR